MERYEGIPGVNEILYSFNFIACRAVASSSSTGVFPPNIAITMRYSLLIHAHRHHICKRSPF